MHTCQNKVSHRVLRAICLALLIAFLSSCSQADERSSPPYCGPGPFLAELGPDLRIVKVPPAPERGYHWPFYLYLSPDAPRNEPMGVIVGRWFLG